MEDLENPNPTDISMYAKYVADGLAQGSIKMGLEEVYLEDDELKLFEQETSKYQEKYGLRFDDVQLENARKLLAEQTVQKTIKKLEQAKGWYIIRGSFSVIEQSKSYLYSYIHPINKYYKDAEKEIAVTFRVPKKSTQETDKVSFSLTVCGYIIQPLSIENDTWDIEFRPLVVHY